MIEKPEITGELKDFFFQFYKSVLNLFLMKQVSRASASSHSSGLMLTQ